MTSSLVDVEVELELELEVRNDTGTDELSRDSHN